MQKIKILFFINSLLQEAPSAPNQVQKQLLHELSISKPQHIEIICIVSKRYSCDIPLSWKNNFDIIDANFFKRELYKAIINATYIHVLGLSVKIAVLSLLTRKVVTTIHGDATFILPKKYFSKKTLREFKLVKILDMVGGFRKLKAVSAVSNTSSHLLKSKLKLNNKSITPLYNGVSDVFFEGIHRNDKVKYKNHYGKYICIVNNKAPKKNFLVALQCFEYLIANGLYSGKLVIAGDGYTNNEDGFKKIIPEAKSKIEFAGYLQPSELVSLYSGASLLLNPTLHETFGLPNIEALLCGCPVITSNKHSIKEVTREYCLYAENPNEVTEIIPLIIYALSSDYSVPRNIKYIFSDYKWSSAAERYLKWYENV